MKHTQGEVEVKQDEKWPYHIWLEHSDGTQLVDIASGMTSTTFKTKEDHNEHELNRQAIQDAVRIELIWNASKDKTNKEAAMYLENGPEMVKVIKSYEEIVNKTIKGGMDNFPALKDLIAKLEGK